MGYSIAKDSWRQLKIESSIFSHNKLVSVNFSPMSPKLLITHLHRQEDRGIDLAPIFLWFVLLKLLSNQLKALSDFLTVLFVFVYFEFCWLQQKRTDILVLKVAKMWIFKVHYLLSNKFDTKINAILVISELMASVGKVLQWWKYFVCNVNSVHEACAKCFAVHISKFEILQITWFHQ